MPMGPITADLTDPDGGVTASPGCGAGPKFDPPGATDDDPVNRIDTATSATYTPTNADTSYFLHVTATYMDAKNDDPVLTRMTARRKRQRRMRCWRWKT